MFGWFLCFFHQKKQALYMEGKKQMKRMYDESEVRQIVLEVLNSFGMFINQNGQLEFDRSTKFNYEIHFDDTAELRLPSAVYFDDGALMSSKPSIDLGDDDVLVTKYYYE